MNLIGRTHDFPDTDIMIDGVDDQRDEFTHIRNGKIGAVQYRLREISKIGCDNPGNISLFIIFVELLQSVCKKSECGTDDDAIRIRT